jgi:mono/diheme cytochrome c family protein
MRSRLIVAVPLLAVLSLAVAMLCCDDEARGYPAGPELAKLTDAAARAKVSETVETLFGTPQHLRTPHGSGIDLARVTLGRDAYRGLCLHCHGEFGDGAGPAAAGMDPLPRDFRMGVFKFTSTKSGEKPTRGDLVATLRRGMPLGRMPSFAALEEEKLDWLAEYVIFLASRGELERRLAARAANDDDVDEATATQVVATIGELWAQAPAAVVTPGSPMPELDARTLARGHDLFQSKEIKCSSCHGPEGKGNGPSAPGLKDDWDHLLAPRDLTLGVYRGGSRPIDIFRTICCGVKGTPMPAFGGTVSPDDLWALALYVRSLGAKGSPVW